MKISCSICITEMTCSDMVSTTCGHVFHSLCIQEWLGKHGACPQCRAQCSTIKLFVSDDEVKTGGADAEVLNLKSDLLSRDRSLEDLSDRNAELHSRLRDAGSELSKLKFRIARLKAELRRNELANRDMEEVQKELLETLFALCGQCETCLKPEIGFDCELGCTCHDMLEFDDIGAPKPEIPEPN